MTDPDAAQAVAARDHTIGPGRLVLIVGPSGAGKDTLIDYAKAAVIDDSSIVFPRRIITRSGSAGEEHDSLTDEAFGRSAQAGAFALWWHAHGLSYGIPASIDDDILNGRTVMCNVSRAIVAQARERYATVLVVLVTAPAEILAARLAGRGREASSDIAGRLQRSASVGQDLQPDHVILNTGVPQDAGSELVALIRHRQIEAGVVAAVSMSPTHSFGKAKCDAIRLVAGLGVDGDAHHGATVKHRSRVARDPSQPNLRQVHLISCEIQDELRAAGFDVGPGQIGENITTRGIDLLALPTATRLHIGAAAVVEITGLRNPCYQLDQFQSGLMTALLGRESNGGLIRKAGVMSIVTSSGEVLPGDPIVVELPAPPHKALRPV